MQLSFLSLVYFIGFSHALIMAIALSRQTEQGQSGRLLALLLFLLAYNLFEGGVIYSSLYKVIPHMIDWLPASVLIIGPLFYGYICAVSGDSQLTRKQWLIHLSPAILMVIVHSPEVFVSTAEKIAHITPFQTYEHPTLLPWRTIIFFVILKVHLATYLGTAWKILTKFEHKAEYLRADNSQLILNRHKQLCLSLIALEALWVVLFVLQQTSGIYALDYVSKSWLLFMAVIILAMGYYGLKQPSILFSEVERSLVLQEEPLLKEKQPSLQAVVSSSAIIAGNSDNENDSSKQINKETPLKSGKYQLSSIPESTAQEIVLLIRNILQTQQLYLDDKLTLTSLSEALELKPHLVSQVINQTMQTSFYKLINQSRVEYAITLIGEPNIDWSLERIAFESGFGNRVTFNTAFKALKGCSPSVFKKNLKLTG